MLSVKNNFVVERNVLLMHRGPTYAPSYPLLKEDKDEMRRLKMAQTQKREKAGWADQPQKMESKKTMQDEEKEVRPILVDEICHVCATCEKVTERDFKSRDGTKCFCSYTCKLKGERPQMARGMRRQDDLLQAAHMKK